MSKSVRIGIVSASLITLGLALWYIFTGSEEVGSKSEAGSVPPSSTTSQPIPSIDANSGKEARREALLQATNHQPIEFYGKVLDQNDVPIAGAEIGGRVTVNNGLVARIEQPTTRSDEHGNFSFSGMMGRTLDFSVVKPGYQYTPATDAFDFTLLVPAAKRHRPDPKNPVVVRMWKLSGAEPMFAGGKLLSVPSDGERLRFDLATGSIVESGGDLILSLRHQRRDKTGPTQPFDWTLDVEAVEGGIAWSSKKVEHMLLAPDDGYASEVSVFMQGIDPRWQNRIERSFFLKSRGVRYSRLLLIVECTPKQPTSSIQLVWWQNPASRNLEFDPSRKLNAH
jgi:hypothetical protein